MVFARTLRALESGRPEEVAKDHVARLSAWLDETIGGLPPEVPNAEYSVELQLSILGLEVETLRPPILDVGCGPGARLVHHLRGLGLEAWGVDRDSSEPVVIGADWLDYDYGERRWGTVISHQAFSLHFLHHHFRRGEAAHRHGEVYAAILKGLAPGGAFVYAPALPFVESVLPNSDYRIERRPLPAELGAGLEWVRRLAPEMEVSYASRVIKRN